MIEEEVLGIPARTFTDDEEQAAFDQRAAGVASSEPRNHPGLGECYYEVYSDAHGVVSSVGRNSQEDGLAVQVGRARGKTGSARDPFGSFCTAKAFKQDSSGEEHEYGVVLCL